MSTTTKVITKAPGYVTMEDLNLVINQAKGFIDEIETELEAKTKKVQVIEYLNKKYINELEKQEKELNFANNELNGYKNLKHGKLETINPMMKLINDGKQRIKAYTMTQEEIEATAIMYDKICRPTKYTKI